MSILLDEKDLLRVIKEAAIGVENNKKGVGVVFGHVISEAPLKISIDQKITLSEIQLVLSRNVKKYEVIILIETIGEKKAMVDHRLKIGDKAVLLRMEGGQRFVVLDKL